MVAFSVFCVYFRFFVEVDAPCYFLLLRGGARLLQVEQCDQAYLDPPLSIVTFTSTTDLQCGHVLRSNGGSMCSRRVLHFIS